MSEEQSATASPRWGQVGREKKAEAILATLQLHFRRDLTQGLWLDIGCGNGGVAATLAFHVKQVVGIDPESWKFWQTLSREHPNLALHAVSYRDLKSILGTESVDVVVCNQVYEHVDDPVALLQAIHSVIKPGGLCYFAGPNFLWPIEPHLHWPIAHWLPRAWVMFVIRKFKVTWASKWDARPWSYWKLTRAFRRAGFRHASAIHDRLRADVELGNSRVSTRIAAQIPVWLTAALTPLTPGFVFALVRI